MKFHNQTAGPEGPSQIRSEVTKLLIEWNGGSKLAMDLLIPLVYRELRGLAESYLRNERSAVTVQPTALIHEAYLRLVAQDLPNWESRSHFFGVAAQLMRQVLVDRARRNKSRKRGGGAPKVPLENALSFSADRSPDLIALDDALTALAQIDPRKCKVIEMRFFGGFRVEETAEALDISVATVGREQRLAEAWLHRELKRNQVE
jgi:RNA polymerase sigma-70 factor, ECF subfamily